MKKINESEIITDIDGICIEYMSSKPEGLRFITYPEGQAITHRIRRCFQKHEGDVPNEITFACTMSEAVLAPTTQERIRLIKKAASLGLGTSGIIAILTGIGMALGWGNGVLAAVIVWFTGGPVMWPIVLGVGGAALVVVAGYFAIYDNPQKQTERFIKTLKSSISAAIKSLKQQDGNPGLSTSPTA